MPQVTWTKDGKPLTSNDIMEVKYKNGVASMTVEEIYPEDAGRYACKATNAKGSVETSSRVKASKVFIQYNIMYHLQMFRNHPINFWNT